jgi:hypothetical protein
MKKLLVMAVFLICVGASAAQQAAQQPTPQDSEDVVSTATQDDPLTKVIAERLRSRLIAFKKVDAAAYGTFLTDNFRSVDPVGLLHAYKPTSQEFASFPITQFIASQVLAVPIGQDGALVTYTLQLIQANAGPVKLTIGEVWVKQAGSWKSEYSQSTVTF